MKKAILLIGLFAVMCSALFAQQLTVAVSPFEARGGLTKDDADAITELFISALVSDGTVKVVDRNSFEKIVAEMKFQASDWTDNNMVAKLGEALKANSFVRGSAMNLAGSAAVTATILDINTVQLTASSTLKMNDMSEIFDKLPAFVNELMGKGKQFSYKIGDTGPGGGIIFAAEGNSYMEVSRLLGDHTWDAAIRTAKNYNGGGYNDWYLPSQGELNLIYQNLQKSGVVNLGTSVYWSSSQYSNNVGAWGQRFSDGGQDGGSKNYAFSVRAVRAF